MSTPSPPGPDDRLDSWKEIAAYLKRGVRTVQRWEQSSGLPVHRLDPARQGVVFAYKPELDAWWASRGAAPPNGEAPAASAPLAAPASRWRLWTAVGPMLMLGAGFFLTRGFSPHSSHPVVLNPVPLTSDLGSEVEPTFSPDGNEVAYAWDGPQQNKWDIYVKMIGSDSPLRLTRGSEPNAEPSWSPDGRWIAFLRFLRDSKTCQLLAVPPIGGSEKVISENARLGGALAWTPDSRWIIASRNEAPDSPMGLVAIDVNSGEIRRLTRPPRQNWGDFDPAVAPDGASIVFTRDLGSTSEIYRLRLKAGLQPDGGLEQLTAHHRWTAMPAFTSTGNAIVYSSGIKDDVASLWLLPLKPAGPPRLLLSSTNSYYQPALSARRNRLAFSVGRIFRVDTWRMDLSEDFKPLGRPVRLISSTHTDYNAQYSPDGKQIVFHSTRSGASEIWLAGADGSNAVRLTNFDAPITGSPRWSPDGQWIVFDSNKEGQFEVYRMRKAGGAPERLTNNPAIDGVPSYSRDGRSIYFMSNRSGSNQVWKMDADGRNPRQITRGGGYLAFESFDRAWLYYSRADGDSPLYRVKVDGGDETEVLPRVNEFGFFLTPKGVLFSGGERSAGLEFMDFATKKISPFFQPERPMTVGLSISPDQRHVLFPQRESSGSDLMLVENFSDNQ